MPSALTVQVGFPVDDQVLSDLHARAFTPAGAPPETSTQPWGARLQRHSLAWVGAFDGERLIGFVHACWDGSAHAFLLDAVVDPDHQHRGVGTLVVERLVSEVEEAGCEWLHVDFEPRLEPFYQACGFQPTSAGLMSLGRGRHR